MYLYLDAEDIDVKVAFCSSHHQLIFLNNIYRKYFLLNEHLYTHLTGFFLKLNNFMYELANEVTENLISGGILQHSVKIGQENSIKYGTRLRSEMQFDSNDDKDKIMTYADFSYGFTLWIFACLISMIGFLLELTSHYIKMEPLHHVRSIFGLVGILKVLFIKYRSGV